VQKPSSFYLAWVVGLAVAACPMAGAVVCDPPERVGLEERVDTGSFATIVWTGSEYGMAQ
jgi:hypothetical protein